MFRSLQFLVIVVGAYNIVALLTGPSLGTAVVECDAAVRRGVGVTVGELIILAGIALLFLEIVKASRSRASGIDHALSMTLFVIALLEFLLVPACGTSVFLIVTALSLMNVIAGFTVSLSTAHRDITIS